jgi:hypothetical protein
MVGRLPKVLLEAVEAVEGQAYLLVDGPQDWVEEKKGEGQGRHPGEVVEYDS